MMAAIPSSEALLDAFNSALNSNDHLELCRFLKRAPANFDVDQPLPGGGSRALAIAVKNRNLNAVRLLVKRGADIFYKDADGDTYLHLAVYTESYEMVKLFSQSISWHEKNNELYSPYDYIYYHLDKSSGAHAYMCECLGSRRSHELVITVNTMSLHNSVRYRNLKIVKKCLEAGADPNLVTRMGSTIFQESFNQFPDGQAFDLFLDHGGDVFRKNPKGFSSLHYAVVFGRSLDVIRRILDMGADPNEQTNRGDTPCIAMAYRNIRIKSEELAIAKLKLLRERGADLSAMRQKDGMTCLYQFCTKSAYKVVQYLLSSGVNTKGFVHDNRKDFSVPIIRAVQQKDYRLVEILLDHGVNLDSYWTYKGSDMLHLMMMKTKDEQMKFKLAKLFVRKRTGMMPMLQLRYGRKLFS